MRDLAHYNAVVVGAGPAGSAAALRMAAAGLSVALLERGDHPGSKNMFGGVIYSRPTAEIVPEFWQEAPLERAVTRDSLWFLDEDSAVELGFTGLRFGQAPYNKHTAFRPRFDRWLAGKAVQAGATLEVQAVAREVVYAKSALGRGPARGVRLDDGSTVEGDVVVLAEGVQAFLTKKAGLAKRIDASQLSLWVREVIALPAGKIEDRFLLERDEGSDIVMLGYPAGQAIGMAGLFTNRDSISLTLGMPLSRIAATGASLPDLLTRLKEHRFVRRLVQGGKTVEFAARMIPMGGKPAMPRLYDDGLLVAGDAAIMISGRRGSDLAMLSGALAADTVIQARAKQDFSAAMLRRYDRNIRQSFFGRNINRAGDPAKYYQRYGDANYLLTSTLNDVAYRFFQIGLETDQQKVERMKKLVLDKQPPVKTVVDLLAGLRGWGVL